MSISEDKAWESSVEDYYNDGFEDGYTWLTRGWNFLHPYGSFTYESGRVIRGYIPGGPTAGYNHASYGSKEYLEKSNIIHAKRTAWHNGWIDGINKYVRDNNLDYAQIPNER